MTGQKRRLGGVQPGLSVEYCDVDVDGQSVGVAVSLGSRFVFYTTDERLEDLDGIRFESMQVLRETVLAAVRADPEPTLAA